jgi:soluble lytic murein transglycosylase
MFVARLLCPLVLLTTAASGADADRLTEQRAAFRAALPAAETGRWPGAEPYLDTLADYPLLPDLRAAWLRASLGPGTDTELAGFLQRYPDLGFSADLRVQWARSLAARGDWVAYLQVHDRWLRDSADTGLECLALRARRATGDLATVRRRGVELWLSPYSQPRECDPVFEFLAEDGLLSDARRRERIALALDAGQTRLARFLARPLGKEDQQLVDRWTRVRSAPDRELSRSTQFSDTAADRRLISYGFHRLARLDPERARALWPTYDTFGFSPARRLDIERAFALNYARRDLPGALTVLEAQAAVDDDPLIGQWRTRLAIRALNWRRALDAIATLAPDASAETNWDFWRARALSELGQPEQAAAIFEALADERGYYSFLSADHLDRTYRWSDEPATPDESIIATLAERSEFVRARELFMTGLYSRGRREWSRALSSLTREERAQASLLAQRWGWHSRAIATAAGTGLIDDLALRYPLPWRDAFERLSLEARVDPTLAYGVARSESLFMPDVASAAGAIGLMQLMPATGRETARQARIPYRGSHSLTDPETNIALGTRYLGQMLVRFDNHPALAAAAYNAGPDRVERWLPDNASLPADVWIDTIPFRETRRYVRRVLASDTVFDWRLNAQPRRLSERLPPVQPRRGGTDD